MERLFVYGTLQDETIQNSLIGRTVPGVPDRLNGYKISHVLMPPYPVAMPADSASIDGQILEISADELIKLDEYEGECYLRIEVWLESGQKTWVYIGNHTCFPDYIDGD